MRQKAFTLIELLVVITIIIVLLALLGPSMNRAIDATYRAVCASNLHQMQLANISFATDHLGKMVAGRPVIPDTAGHFTVWKRQTTKNNTPNYDPVYGKYTDHGVLQKNGYIVSGEVFYCPSSIDEKLGFENEKNGYWNKQSDIPADQDVIHTGYVSNSTLDSEPTGGENINQLRAPRASDLGSTAVFADLFGSTAPFREYNVEWHHKVGYTVARLDGSVYFYNEHKNRLILYRDPWSPGIYFSGETNYTRHIDWVWRKFSGTQ